MDGSYTFAHPRRNGVAVRVIPTADGATVLGRSRRAIGLAAIGFASTDQFGSRSKFVLAGRRVERPHAHFL